MTITKALVTLAMLTMILTSCSDINFTEEGYRKAVRSGLQKIPEAHQFDEIFGRENVDHFISYHGTRSVGNDWNSETYFEGRYILTMQVPVRVNYKFNQVLKVLGKPQFYLIEVRAIKLHGEDKIPGATSEGSNDWPYPFTAEYWAKVYKAKGDFSVIGIQIKRKQPVKDFEKYVRAIRKDRVKVSRSTKTEK